MSDFNVAIKTVLQHEGLYSNDPDDPGGATKYGISLRWLRSLEKVEGVDPGDLDGSGDVDVNDVKLLTAEGARMFYRVYWWNKYCYEHIEDQSIATKIFDLSVNMGSRPAHRCLQRAIRAATGTAIAEDGIIGQQTLKSTNAANPSVLLAALRSEAAGYYRSLNKPKFLNGWLNRAYS